jgi:hypothetical protein
MMAGARRRAAVSNVMQMRRRIEQQPLGGAEPMQAGELIEQVQRKTGDVLDMSRSGFHLVYKGQELVAGCGLIHE